MFFAAAALFLAVTLVVAYAAAAAPVSVGHVAAQHADDLAHVNDDAARVMLGPTPLRRPTPGRRGVQRVPCFQPNDPGPGDSGRRN